MRTAICLLAALQFVIKETVSSPVEGFVFLDDQSKNFTANELILANIPFTANLSMCLWYNPTWVRKRKYCIWLYLY